ncbi:MAG: hypothetical protein HWN65_14070 [Candidatus Helarchaeota archaeon]|nr:hypothetical protein [Candidatus Helarchaeota archaeon]
MSNRVQKKIVLKIFDKTPNDDELEEYAKKKKMNISKFSESSILLGEVWIGEELYGMLGLAREQWFDTTSFHPSYDLIKRITIRLHKKSGKTIGKLEERLIKELSLSDMGGKFPIFTATLRDFPFDIDLDRESDKLLFSMLTNTRRRVLDIFQITKKTLAIRSHFMVKRKFWDQRVAVINSKGGHKIEVKIFDEDLARNEYFIRFLILFSGSIKFHNEIESKLHHVTNALNDATLVIQPSKESLGIIASSRVTKLSGSAEAVFTEKKVKPEKAKKIKEPKAKKEKPKKEKPKKEKPKEKPVKKIKVEKPPKEVIVEKPPTRPRMKEAPKKPKKTVKLEPLDLEDSVKEITDMTEEQSTILEDVGISIVDDLLFIDPEVLADFIAEESITAEIIKEWQTTSKTRIDAKMKKAEAEKTKFLKKYEEKEKEHKLL